MCSVVTKRRWYLGHTMLWLLKREARSAISKPLRRVLCLLSWSCSTLERPERLGLVKRVFFERAEDCRPQDRALSGLFSCINLQLAQCCLCAAQSTRLEPRSIQKSRKAHIASARLSRQRKDVNHAITNSLPCCSRSPTPRSCWHTWHLLVLCSQQRHR
jgi:hypothetical protein